MEAIDRTVNMKDPSLSAFELQRRKGAENICEYVLHLHYRGNVAVPSPTSQLWLWLEGAEWHFAK